MSSNKRLLTQIIDILEKEDNAKIKKLNAEIAAYKSLLYDLCNETNVYIVDSFLNNELDLILDQEKDLEYTTPIKSFLTNLYADCKHK